MFLDQFDVTAAGWSLYWNNDVSSNSSYVVYSCTSVAVLMCSRALNDLPILFRIICQFYMGFISHFSLEPFDGRFKFCSQPILVYGD